MKAEAEERERLLSSTQQLLKIAQEQLFKGASAQGETRGQMLFDLHEARSHAERLRDEYELEREEHIVTHSQLEEVFMYSVTAEIRFYCLATGAAQC